MKTKSPNLKFVQNRAFKKAVDELATGQRKEAAGLGRLVGGAAKSIVEAPGTAGRFLGSLGGGFRKGLVNFGEEAANAYRGRPMGSLPGMGDPMKGYTGFSVPPGLKHGPPLPPSPSVPEPSFTPGGAMGAPPTMEGGAPPGPSVPPGGTTGRLGGMLNGARNWMSNVDPKSWQGKLLFGGTGSQLADPMQRAGVGMGRAGVAAGIGGGWAANGAANQYIAGQRRDKIRQMNRFQLGLGGLLGGSEGVINQLGL